MIGHMLIITPEGAHEHQHFAAPIPDPGVLQKAVGGYIEVVPLFDTIEIEGELQACVAFCNEDGKGERLRLNQRATFLWERALQRRKEEPRTLQEKDGGLADYLVGNVAVLWGDEDFMGEL